MFSRFTRQLLRIPTFHFPVTNPSSTQIKSTGQTSKSCGCTSDIELNQNPVPYAPERPAEQATAEQPTAGTSNQSIGLGSGKLAGDKS